MKVTALLRVCYRSVTALLRVCYASVTALLPLCYRSATALLPLCYRSVTASVAVCFLAFLGFLFGVLQRSSAAFFPASDFVSINFSYSCCSRIIRFETIIPFSFFSGFPTDFISCNNISTSSFGAPIRFAII